MAKKITVLIFIFIATSIAWMILGATIEFRTATYDERLGDSIDNLWGSPQYQYAPEFRYRYETVTERTEEKTKKKIRDKNIVSGKLPIEKSGIDVNLSLEYRKKGLLWYSTYIVVFDGTYSAVNNQNRAVDATVFHEFPSSGTEYDDFHIYLNGVERDELEWQDMGIGASVRLEPNEEITFRVLYTSRGQGSWEYAFGKETMVEVRNFVMKVKTDFVKIDFPVGSISPTAIEETGSGMMLTWEYEKRVSGKYIGVLMPERLNPGPLASKITFFAPISLLFFFFIIFIITTVKEIRMHPMNYFFLACAFFAFNLLFAYLVDHLSVNLSFIISSVVSLILVITYLRLVAGARFALVEAGISQLIYLVLFSYTFFFKGYTGLIITIAAIITLFAIMQLTGRIDWEEKFNSQKKIG